MSTFAALAHTYAAPVALGAPAALFQLDGTAWLHAASPGTRTKGESTFTIDQATTDNFVRVFATGYPRSVPVDYDHGTTMADGTGNAPASGAVLEMRSVWSAADLAAMPGAAEKVARAGRTPDDPENFGLWVRVKPTARARKLIEDAEYTSMSIAFAHDLPHPETGAPQGPAIFSIALTNTPFLDNLVPVAASRGPGGIRPHPDRESIMPNTILTSLSALFGKPVEKEDDILTLTRAAIEAKDAEIEKARPLVTYAALVADELGEGDGSKAVSAIRTLKQEREAAKVALAKAATDGRKAQVAAIVTKYERKMGSALQREHYTKSVDADLAKGQQPGETDTEKVLASTPDAPNLTPGAAPAGGDAAPGTAAPAAPQPVDRDAEVAKKADEYMRGDDAVKALAAKGDRFAAYTLALEKANDAVPYPPHPQRTTT